MSPATHVETVAAALFGAALVHTFAVKLFERLAQRHPHHAGLLHLLGAVEVVFGFFGPSCWWSRWRRCRCWGR